MYFWIKVNIIFCMKRGFMKRIVIADDNEELLKQIQKNMEKCNEIDIVGVAKDGKEELDSIKRLLPDLVITDIEMKKLSTMSIIRMLEKNIELYRKRE